MQDDAAAPAPAPSPAPAKGVAPGLLWRVGLTNLPFLLALVAIGYLPDLAKTLVVGSILFLVPGVAWTDQRRGDAVLVLFKIVLKSLAAGLIVWLALIALPGPVSRSGYILALAAVTNAGLYVGFRQGWWTASPFATPIAKLMLAAAAVFYLQTFLGAAYFVPALEDQDMETQGTAYGLINEATPTIPINRPTGVGGRLFFAHPLLLHFWIGESALISNDLDRLRHYHEGSLAARDGASPLVQYNIALVQFERDPVLIPTRTPNLFLAAFVMFPLGFFVFRMTGSGIAALGSCALYATLPEVYVRSSYGGYMGLTNLLLTSGAYFYVQAVGLFPDQKASSASAAPAGRLAGFAGYLSGWADQKAILLALAAPPHAAVRALLDRPFMTEALALLRKADVVRLAQLLFSRSDIRIAFIIGASFIAGWATFALYGLIVAPGAFIADHLVGHLASRLTLSGVEVFGRDFVYPSITALWIEFIDHSGWLLAPLAALAGLYAAGKVREAPGLLLIWVAIGAIGFSLVDWRQTKHLAHLLPALAILVGIWWASLKGHVRAAASVAVGAALLWNIWRVGLTMSDFSTIQPTPIW